MPRRSLKVAIAALALAMAGLTPAAAQNAPAWRQIQIEGGCVITVRGGLPEGATMTWDQPCTSGRPVEGEGSARLTLPDGRSATVTGPYVAGVPNGSEVMTLRAANGAVIRSIPVDFNMGCQPNHSTCVPFVPN